MQIALISVAPPYRGGISKHTSILTEYLSKKHSVDLINYSRQYPDFLFPGKSQFLGNKLDNCFNLTVTVKEYKDRVIFLRKIIDGSSDRSYGIHVAKMAGVPKSIIDRSKEILSMYDIVINSNEK